jgi:glycosyltransferase involved in cell wall biosynthesis
MGTRLFVMQILGSEAVNIVRGAYRRAVRRSARRHRPDEQLRRLTESSEVFNALSRTALFDHAWYRDRYGFRGGRLDACYHYLNEGVELGWDPHPLFSTRWYLTSYPDVVASGQNPLHHYLTSGSREGLWPHPLFDPASLPISGGGAVAASTGPTDLERYLATPAMWSEKPSRLFDGAWYLETYPDVEACGRNPLYHFVVNGEAEGRWPNRLFDPSVYGASFAGEEPPEFGFLAHYLHKGWRESRITLAGVDPEWIRLRYGLPSDPLAYALDVLLPSGQPLRAEDELILTVPHPSLVDEVLRVARGLSSDVDPTSGGVTSSGDRDAPWIQRATSNRAPFLAEWASGVQDDSTSIRLRGVGDVAVGLGGTQISARSLHRSPSPERFETQRERRRVLLVSHEASLTGAPTYLEQVGVALRSAGHDVMVLSLRDEMKTPVFERCGLPHLLLREVGGGDSGQRAMNDDWSMTAEGESWLASFLAGFRPDVALVNSVLAVAACQRLFATGTPYVVLVHERTGFGPWAGTPADRFSRTVRSAFVAAETVLFGSKDTQSVWQRHSRLPFGEVALTWRELSGMPVPSNPQLFRAAHGISNDDFVYATIGSLEPRKRVIDIIRAFAALDEPGARLVVVGDGGDDPPTHLGVRMAAASDPRVVLLPKMSNPAPAFLASDCFIMASERETFPMVLQEAQIFELSVITSRFPGWDELPSSDSMLTFEVGDCPGLTERMRQVRREHSDRRPERVAAREHMATLARVSNEHLIDLLLSVSVSAEPRLATRDWLHHA